MMQHENPNQGQAPYDLLTPDAVLDAMESIGLEPTGGLTALNSYENRVYQVALEDGSFIITKFYRPNRWSDDAITEEHRFTQGLFDAELSVVPPVQLNGTSVFRHLDFRFAVFARQGGHPPNLENEDDLEVLARAIARLHAYGASRPFEHRVSLTTERLGVQSRDFLLQNNFLPAEMEAAYSSITEQLLARIAPLMSETPMVAIHGDCHMGNILWRDDIPHFVDFDDCMSGPPIQDLWMLLSGERADRTLQLSLILDAYQEFYDFDTSTLHLIEPLRTLRIMYHAAWIARRWQDPAFPLAFPTFDTVNYWSNHVLALREQLAMLDEPPLTYFG
jgi:Ser/Thr protein kinase RdoA (MazF antagonist)